MIVFSQTLLKTYFTVERLVIQAVRGQGVGLWVVVGCRRGGAGGDVPGHAPYVESGREESHLFTTHQKLCLCYFI